MNNHIFAFDGHEVEAISLAGNILKNHETLVGPYTISYRYYDPTHNLSYSLKKLALYFYKVQGKKPLPIYSNPEDSVHLLKSRISMRDKHPRHKLEVSFNGTVLEEFKNILNDRCLMEEYTLESYDIEPGSILDVKI